MPKGPKGKVGPILVCFPAFLVDAARSSPHSIPKFHTQSHSQFTNQKSRQTKEKTPANNAPRHHFYRQTQPAATDTHPK